MNTPFQIYLNELRRKSRYKRTKVYMKIKALQRQAAKQEPLDEE